MLFNGGTYTEVKSDLIATIGHQETENLSKLTLLKQGVHTPLGDYIASFCKLLSQAAVADERNDLHIWLFLQGLRPERLRTGCLTKGPRMLQEAINVATHLELL